jgi:signal recognition particle subunit SEC65
VPDHYYVYPSYLRKKSPRALGRRVSLDVAVAEVTAEEIVATARSLGYQAEAEPTKQFPREPHRMDGRVKVAKKKGTTKTKLLRELARTLQSRAPRPGPE